MNVLHLTYNDWNAAGGTSVASFRLHSALKRAGHKSKILCRIKNLTTDDSVAIHRSRLLERGIREITGRLGLNDLQGVSSFFINRYPVYQQADLVHLHSLHSGYFNYFALPGLTRQKPCLWSLHDLWALTGHCSYHDDCERWKSGCGSCPYPLAYPPIKRDATKWEWKFKKWVYRHSNFEILVATKWLADQVRESPLLNRFPVHVIPFGINTEVYEPIPQASARQKWNIPLGKKTLLYVSTKLNDLRKGPDLLIQSLNKINHELRKQIVLILMGKNTEHDLFKECDIPVVRAGFVEDDRRKAEIYSAADLFVCPSRSETFALTALESLACGTPVVAFRIGGMWEHVRHGTTGLVVSPENTDEFAHAIQELLENDLKRLAMKNNARQMVVAEYREESQVQRTIDLYKEVIAK